MLAIQRLFGSDRAGVLVINVYMCSFALQLAIICIPTNLQTNLCLRNVSNLLDLEYVLLLENAVCPFKMYRHGVTGKHKK